MKEEEKIKFEKHLRYLKDDALNNIKDFRIAVDKTKDAFQYVLEQTLSTASFTFDDYMWLDELMRDTGVSFGLESWFRSSEYSSRVKCYIKIYGDDYLCRCIPEYGEDKAEYIFDLRRVLMYKISILDKILGRLR